MVKTYPKNCVIYSRGDEPQTIYLVKEGEVELSVDVNDDQEHRWPTGIREWKIQQTSTRYKNVVRSCGYQEIFGSAEVIKKTKRRATARAKTKITLYLINKDTFM